MWITNMAKVSDYKPYLTDIEFTEFRILVYAIFGLEYNYFIIFFGHFFFIILLIIIRRFEFNFGDGHLYLYLQIPGHLQIVHYFLQ